MVFVWLGLYFVSAKRSSAVHKVKLAVPNLAQERHVDHWSSVYQQHWSYTDPYTESFTLSYVTCFARRIIVNYH